MPPSVRDVAILPNEREHDYGTSFLRGGCVPIFVLIGNHGDE